MRTTSTTVKRWTRRSLEALCLAICIGCGTERPQPAEPAPASAPAPAPTKKTVDPATTGNIEGAVTLAGKPPAPQPINMSSDPFCAELGRSRTQTVVVDRSGGLQSVFVYVKTGLEDFAFPVPTTPVVLDQRRCTYVPRVFGIQAGQPLEILNSDDTLHNVHARPERNREFDRGQATKGETHTHRFPNPEVMVPFRCDVHRWMNAWAGVTSHPFYAVSTANGSFAIRGLPPGTYTVEAWHERLGTQAHTVTVTAKGTERLDISFSS